MVSCPRVQLRYAAKSRVKTMMKFSQHTNAQCLSGFCVVFCATISGLRVFAGIFVFHRNLKSPALSQAFGIVMRA